MMTDEKSIALLFIFCLIHAVSGGFKCEDNSSSSPSTDGYSGHSPRVTVYVCCKAEEDDVSVTVTHFACQAGCCGERDNQHCCSMGSGDDDNKTPYVIGGTLGAAALGSIVALLVWIYRKSCRSDRVCNDHKKLLKEVYAVESLEELFVPSQPLVSAPGTIIHPMTNINGPFYTTDPVSATSYVMPDPLQPQPHNPPLPPPAMEHPVSNNNGDDDFNEENWDQWDGFPASADQGGAGAAADSAGRGRDNPYYEQYDKYSQPPPGYEEVTQ